MHAVGCGIFEAAWDRDGASGLLGGQPHRALSGSEHQGEKVWRGMICVRAQDCQGLQAVPPQTKSRATKGVAGANAKGSCTHRQLALKKPFWEEPRRKKVSFPGTWHASPYESGKTCLLLLCFSSALYWRSMISCRLQRKRISMLSPAAAGAPVKPSLKINNGFHVQFHRANNKK